MNNHPPENPVITSALLDLTRAVRSVHTQMALVGGQALQSYGVPRTTEDADTLVPHEDLASITAKKKPTVSRVILAFAHGDGVVLLCEESSALDFVQESGSASSIDGFTLRDCGVSIEEKCDVSGIYVGELHVVDGGPETWEMPEIRDYYPEIRNLRPITKDEWKSHLSGEWPEGWNELQQAQG